MKSERKFDDLSQVTQTVEFAYNEIDSRVFGVDAEQDKTTIETALDMAIECQRQVWAWVYQPPLKDVDGFLCRATVACWVFVPHLRAYTMTEMAGRLGKKKQSLERWMADFKKQFPAVTAHLQHTLTK